MSSRRSFRQGSRKSRPQRPRIRVFDRSFGTSHLLFTCIDDTYEKALDAATVSLSRRLSDRLSEKPPSATVRSAPQRVVESIVRFYEAGVRHVVLDFVGPYEQRDRQIERFARGSVAAPGWAAQVTGVDRLRLPACGDFKTVAETPYTRAATVAVDVRSRFCGVEDMTSAPASVRPPLPSWWKILAIVTMLFGFSVLIGLTVEAYRQAPPIPAKVVDPTGKTVFTREDVGAGQQVFLKYGLMANGTIWGHGAYLGPDFSATYLHNWAVEAADQAAQARFQRPYARPHAGAARQRSRAAWRGR